MVGNSRMKLPDATQERSVGRGRGLAASAAAVVQTDHCHLGIDKYISCVRKHGGRNRVGRSDFVV